MKNFIKIKILLLTACCLLLFFSCKTKEKLIYVPEIRTEYKTKHTRDSIFQKDSVFIYHKGDTVFVNKYKYLYKDRWRADTLIRVDTISVVVKVTETKEVNKLTRWQTIRLKVFDWLLAGLAAIILFIFRRQIWRLIKIVFNIL